MARPIPRDAPVMIENVPLRGSSAFLGSDPLFSVVCDRLCWEYILAQAFLLLRFRSMMACFGRGETQLMLPKEVRVPLRSSII